ncbi:cyclic nucleotide-binding domain-containing protein [Lachnospiraceae bacterium ZAX-1]
MELVNIPSKKRFVKRKDKMKALYVILQGSVRATAKHDEWDLEAGSIIGIMESASGTFLCDYTTTADTIAYAFAYTNAEDFKAIFSNEEKYLGIFSMGSMKQASNLIKRYQNHVKTAKAYHSFLLDMFQQYEALCESYGILEKTTLRVESIKQLILADKVETWTIEYYNKMASLSLKTVEEFWAIDYSIGVGQILNASYWMGRTLSLINQIGEYLVSQKEILIGERDNALYGLYLELLRKAVHKGRDIDPICQNITKILEFAKASSLYSDELLQQQSLLYKNLDVNRTDGEEEIVWEDVEEGIKTGQTDDDPKEREKYMERILAYAGYDQEKSKIFQEEVEKYKELPDILSTAEDVRILRKKMTEHFFELYLLVFMRAVEEKHLAPTIKMFLNFGFIDEGLTGEDHTDSLYHLTEELFQCKADNVFTMYEWLVSIYKGENEPSRSEFDLDYQGYLLEQRKTGKIRISEEKILNEDTVKKVEYEIRNMFMSTNRATYGKISIYCPLLCENDIIYAAENMLTTAKKINDALNAIRAIDFSVFYREVAFTDLEHDIMREMVQKEVVPNVILLPNAGSKGMMWQENAGVLKDTPARIAFPILSITDVMEMMIELVARYRWEICRRIQGARWNDITEASLTSEYSDYIQYYRKNQDLSTEAKEKVRNAMQKAKNNFREVFVKDYKNWVKYESKGSFRLNKVARDIIFRYCPFSKEIRKELVINPMYKDMFEKYEIFNQRKIRRVEIFQDRYLKKGGELTPELIADREFYDL